MVAVENVSVYSGNCPHHAARTVFLVTRPTLHFAFACFIVLSSSSLASDPSWLTFEGGSGPGTGKNIVLISGDEEYRSEEALPMLAKILSERHGFRCTVLFAIHPDGGHIDPTYQHNLPGMNAIKGADLVILATRFRTPPEEQMQPLLAYLRQGKPVIGLRTATHGFRGDWEKLGLEVLGEEWVAHHGKHKVQGTRAVAEAAQAGHPILRDVHDIFGPSDVYAVTHLTERATILMRGAVTESLHPSSKNAAGELNEPMMPLVWLNDYQYQGGSRGVAVCTTLGASVDFLSRDLRRLVVNAAHF